MNNEEIKNEMREIGKKLDKLNRNNEITHRTLFVIILILIVFFVMTLIYFLGYFPLI
jgi:amino acid permease